MDPWIIAVCGADITYGAALKNIPTGMRMGFADGLVIDIIGVVKNNCPH